MNSCSYKEKSIRLLNHGSNAIKAFKEMFIAHGKEVSVQGLFELAQKNLMDNYLAREKERNENVAFIQKMEPTQGNAGKDNIYVAF